MEHQHTIILLSDTKFTVNGKLVYKDMNDNWHSKYLSESELKAAHQQISILNTPKTA